jgi:hypothetical protein
MTRDYGPRNPNQPLGRNRPQSLRRTSREAESESGPRTMILKGTGGTAPGAGTAPAVPVVKSPVTGFRAAASSSKRLALPLYPFVISLFLPWIFTIGSVALSPYRLVLLFTTIPCFLMWISGRAGQIRLPDIALFLFWFWCSLSFFVLHGVGTAIQPSGILFFETMGPYLLARCYIRSAEDFEKVVGLLFKAIVFLLPWAILETLTGRDYIKDIFSVVMRTHNYSDTVPRWGLSRVQSVFEHPILFGVICGSILALVHLVMGYGKTAFKRLLRSGAIAVTAFLSLSAGPITAITTQVLLLSWNWLLRGVTARWKILWGILAAMYATIALVSNQTVPEFYLTHFSFDAQSANFRVLIWTFGTESVLLHPWFGVGLGEWTRPDWMPPSIDMFWLIYAVQHGLPAGILLMLAFFSAYLPVSFKKGLDDKLMQYRTGYSIMLTGFFLVGWTVDFWNATYVLFLFLVGSGMWLLDAGNPATRR